MLLLIMDCLQPMRNTKTKDIIWCRIKTCHHVVDIFNTLRGKLVRANHDCLWFYFFLGSVYMEGGCPG